MSANELIKKLRARKVCKDGIRRQPQKHEREAADLLASQAAEIERVLAANKDCLLHFDVMKAENESLREALENALASGLPGPVADAVRQALKGTGADHG